jgi:hypothetical protein
MTPTAKYYNPSEHFAGDEVIVLFKERIIFKQNTPKEHKHFGIKIYKLCGMTGCIYNMSIYLEKNWQNAILTMTVTHAKVKSLTRRVKRVGHKL